MKMPESNFLLEFIRFLNHRVDSRLEAMLTEDNRFANHEDRTAELESKIEELKSDIENFDHTDFRVQLDDHESKINDLESEIGYYSDHEDRINDLEEQIEAVDRSQLIKDATAIIDRRIHELASRGQLRIYVASPETE